MGIFLPQVFHNIGIISGTIKPSGTSACRLKSQEFLNHKTRGFVFCPSSSSRGRRSYLAPDFREKTEESGMRRRSINLGLFEVFKGVWW